MLVRVYTCHNATLLEITCHGSIMGQDMGFGYLSHMRRRLRQTPMWMYPGELEF